MKRNKEVVVLIHGLFRSTSSMSKVKKNLENHDYDVFSIGYKSTSNTIAKLAVDVVNTINEAFLMSDYEKVHFVTHSLGGILLRFIHKESLLNISGNTVMLAPPNHGAIIMDKAPRWSWLQKLIGPASYEMSTSASSTVNTLGDFTKPLGVIAGTSSLNPIWSLITPKPCDSTVTVQSTKLQGMLDHIEVPYIHSLIMNKKDVNAYIVNFLRSQNFSLC